MSDSGATERPSGNHQDSLLSRIIPRSLGPRLAIAISLILLVLMISIVKWIEVEQTNTIRNEAHKEAEALAASLQAGLRTLMLNGDGELAREWLEGMSGISGIKHMQVIRLNGREAFRDLQTIEAVNSFLGVKAFSRQALPDSEGFDPYEHVGPVHEASENRKVWKDSVAGVAKLWMPIPKEEACNACHGYDASPLRGIMHVEISTAEAEERIAYVKQILWLSAALIALLLAALIWWMMQKMVLLPVLTLRQALHDLGDGSSEAELPTTRRDEFGDVARSFKRLEHQWMVREQRLSLILDHVPDGIITVDAEGNIQTVNRSVKEMFGYDEPRLLQRNALKLLGPVLSGKQAASKSTFGHLKVAELTNTIRECIGYHFDGTAFPVELEVCVIDTSFLMFMRDVDLFDIGDSQKYLLFLRDLTARKRGEAEMQLLATVVDQASEAILISDPDGIIEYINPAFTETTGFSPADAIGKKPNILKSGERGNEYYHNMWQALLDGKVWRDTFVNKRKDGSVYQAEQRIAPMRDSHGNISHFVSVQRDITKQKELQEQMEHLQRLEGLGVLAGGIAHDFNNILASIIGNVEIMHFELPEDSELLRYLTPINSAADRGAKLCLELMAYAGKGKRKTEAVNLTGVVKGITNLLDATISRQVTLTSNLDEELPFIMADTTQVEQVIMNLVINATEAIEDSGNVEITTSIRQVEKEWFADSFHGETLSAGRYVCLTVKDDGCGMDENTVNRIFDPFFTTKFSGRGLGMSAVLGIIQNHHGALKCESEPDVGTLFTILFPCADQSQIQDDRVSPLTVSFKGEGKVMIIDDEPAVHRVAGHMFEAMGFSTILISDAREGLEVLKSTPVVAVVVDMSMPLMDGPNFIRKFRKRDKTTPIIVCSGDAREDVISRLGTLPVDDIVSKPFRHADLKRSISKVLGRDAGDDGADD